MVPESVVLRDERTENDWRSVSARIDADGDLIIEGHDLGKRVDSLFNYREYEWTVTVSAADIPKLLDALGGGESILQALQRRFSGDHADGIEAFLKERGIPHEFWNRVGD